MIKANNSIRGALMVGLVSYIFFLFTLANNFSASHDSINYLNGILSGQRLFHQHHLLYHFLANQWLGLFKVIFPGIADHYLIESFTAIWGSATLAICYLFFRNRFNLTPLLSFLGVSVIAFSYGMWFYSVNIEVYAPPLLFILSALYILTRNHPRSSDVWKIAILHSMAILFHQVNILFSLVVLYWLYVNRKELKLVRMTLEYMTIGFVITGGAYSVIGWFVELHNSPQAFIDWILGYTVGHGYWQPLTLKTPFQVLTGFSRAFIGAHYIFQLPAVERFLEQSFRSHGLRDEIFLSENVPAVLAWLLSILTVLFGVVVCLLAFRFIKRFRSMKLHSRVLHPLLLCLLVYSIFFTFWMPEILEFWILQMVIIWLLLIGMLPLIRFPWGISAGTGIAALAICLFVINYFGSIRWLQDINNDWYFI